MIGESLIIAAALVFLVMGICIAVYMTVVCIRDRFWPGIAVVTLTWMVGLGLALNYMGI